MDDIPSMSPKRRREDGNEYDDEPPRKRSTSHTPPNASPSYRLAERPAHRYSREETENDVRQHGERRRSYSPSTCHSPRSSSSSPSRRRRSTPPPKPTTLDYAPTMTLYGHRRGITCVRFSPDGRWLASASADCTINIWDAKTGQLEHSLEGHLAGINTICWSLDSTILASGSDDKSIRLWDTATGMAHPTPFIGHHNYVYSIAFSPKGNMLVSGSYDEAVYLWDVRAARVMRSLPAHSDPVGSVDFVRDGTLIVSCSHDGLIRVWDTATGQCLRTLVHEDNASVSSVAFSPNGKYILAWTLDSCMRLWNYIEGKGKCVKTYQGHTNKKYSLSGSFGTYGDQRAGQEFAFIASGSEDNKVVIWDVSSKNVLQRLEGHTDAVLSVHTHPTERLIASAGLDRTIRLWRPKESVSEAEEEKETTTTTTTNGHQETLVETGVKEEFTNGHDTNLLPPNFFVES